MVHADQDMPAVEAGGAAGGAWQQNPPVCRRVKQLIDDLRDELYVALTLDVFVIYVNDPGLPAVTKEDVKACLKYDDTVKIVNVNGKEIVWLWDGQRLYEFVDRAVNLASEYSEAVVIGEC
jgi:hypothetical protein